MTQLIVAIDTGDFDQARRWVNAVKPHCAMVKLGLEFFCQYGKGGTEVVLQVHPVMLDLKLHDIPSTVAGAVRSIISHFCQSIFLTVHAAGGIEMVRAAVEASRNVGFIPAPIIAAVTVLTSHSVNAEPVADLAVAAVQGGAGALVMSAWEVEATRRVLQGHNLPIPSFIVPGVRMKGGEQHDQVRVATPQLVRAVGADYAVVGRPITRADDPAEAARAFADALS